jgi:hypothetical protein
MGMIEKEQILKGTGTHMMKVLTILKQIIIITDITKVVITVRVDLLVVMVTEVKIQGLETKIIDRKDCSVVMVIETNIQTLKVTEQVNFSVIEVKTQDLKVITIEICKQLCLPRKQK